MTDTIFRFRVPAVLEFGTGSGTLEPVPWNLFLRQITTVHAAAASRLAYRRTRYQLASRKLLTATLASMILNWLELGEKQSTWNWKISLFWSLYIPETVQDNMVTMEDYRICDLSNDDNAADQESTMTDYNKRPFLYFFWGGASWVTLPRSKTQKVGRPSGWELHVNCHHSSAFT